MLILGALAAGSGGLGASAWAHPGLDQQLADLDRRVAELPGDPALYLKRGEVHRLHGDWSLADADFATARKLDPKRVEVDLHLGQLRLDQGKPADAERLLTRFLAAQRDQPAALALRAKAWEALDKPLEAANDLGRAIDKLVHDGAKPTPAHYIDRARALAAAGDKHLPTALRGLDEGLKLLGLPVTLQLEAIDLELRMGHTDAALARLQAQAQQANRKESWWLRMAEIEESAGRSAAAHEHYRLAIQAIEGLPESRRWTRATVELHNKATASLTRLSELELRREGASP